MFNHRFAFMSASSLSLLLIFIAWVINAFILAHKRYAAVPGAGSGKKEPLGSPFWSCSLTDNTDCMRQFVGKRISKGGYVDACKKNFPGDNAICANAYTSGAFYIAAFVCLTIALIKAIGFLVHACITMVNAGDGKHIPGLGAVATAFFALMGAGFLALGQAWGMEAFILNANDAGLKVKGNWQPERAVYLTHVAYIMAGIASYTYLTSLALCVRRPQSTVVAGKEGQPSDRAA